MRRLFIGLTAVVFVAIAIYFLKGEDKVDTLEITEPVVVLDSISKETPEPNRLYGYVIDDLNVLEDKVKRNQNISDILAPYNVKPSQIYKLAQASKDVFDVRKLKANNKYTLIYETDSTSNARQLIYEPNAIDYIVFNLEDTISVEVKHKEVEIVDRTISGVIDYSLFETMKALQVNQQLTNEFVDIFAWQVDFQRLQKGDKFKLIYEDKMVEGESVGIGEIKGVYFEHFENDYYAIPYDQGEGMEFFDEEGESLRKALLKYPIKFTRISSRFTRNRFHPVQKRWKAHKGTDFAAPKGTEIRSVGEGIVTHAGYHKFNGNYVKIRHNSTYTTQYLHMSRIAGGMKPGVKVKQGQPIGYVGSTGLAKGNHLCYRFWKNGVQVDALKVDLPSASPILEENISDFQLAREKVMQQLNDIQFIVEDEPLFAREKTIGEMAN